MVGNLMGPINDCRLRLYRVCGGGARMETTKHLRFAICRDLKALCTRIDSRVKNRYNGTPTIILRVFREEAQSSDLLLWHGAGEKHVRVLNIGR